MNVICSEHNVCMYNQSNQSTTRDRPAGAGGPGGRGLPGGGALPEPDYPRVRLHGRPGIYFMSFPSRFVGGGQRACVRRRRRLPPDTSIKPPPQTHQTHQAIIDHQGAASQSDEAAWLAEEEPRPVSKYADALVQLDNGVKVRSFVCVCMFLVPGALCVLCVCVLCLVCCIVRRCWHRTH